MSDHTSTVSLRSEWKTLRRRIGEAWHFVSAQHKRSLAIAAVLMAVAGVSSTVIALALGRMVDSVAGRVGNSSSPNDLYRLAAICLGLIAGAYAIREALNVLRRYLVENTCTQLSRDTNLKLVAHLLKMNLQRLSEDKLGALHGRIYRSVDGLVRFLRMSFLDFLPALFTGVIALIVAVTKSPLLALVMFGVIPIAVYLTLRQILSQKETRLALMRDCEAIDAAIVEQLSGIEYVRAANTVGREMKRLEVDFEKRRAREIRHHFQMSLYGCAKTLNEGFFHVLVLGTSIYLAIQGAISPGDVLVFSVLFLNVMAPVAEIHRVLDEGHEASLRVGDLMEMLNEPQDHSFDTPQRMEPQPVNGRPIIELDNLVVNYTTANGSPVKALDGVSLSIRHGETIGVAGRSGCGKSTWLKVLLRLTHPELGFAKFGGVPLANVPRDSIGQLIGYVGQQPFVFAGTVAENIAYLKPNATYDEIRRAAERANLHDEIMQLPGGYDAPITERGQNLSGGQRQRLAIARVLLTDAPVLILDEATSALDNISEREVQQALGVRDPNRTIIQVAHRLTTLRHADRIVVFDEGKIVEIGSYNDLLQCNGVFAALIASAEKGISAA